MALSKKLRLSVQDLKESTLRRLVEELLTADEGEEEKILRKLSDADIEEADKERNDLADLKEEKRGAAPKIDSRDPLTAATERKQNKGKS